MIWLAVAALAVFPTLMQASGRITQIDVPRRPPAPVSTLPNVTVVTYAVRGQSAGALIESIRRQGPILPNGDPAQVKTEWRNTVRWKNDGTQCLPQTAELSWSITLILPALADDLEIGPRLRDRWRAYVQQLEAFEYGRIERVNAGMAAMLESMREAEDCEGLAQARRSGEMAVAEAAARYDLETARARRAFRPLT